MIGIIDYGMGNLRSVQKALEHVGANAAVLTRPADAAQADKLVLPGVGAFGDGMTHLRERGWIQPILEWVRNDRPLLGICLGMQLLFEGSQEDAPAPDQPIEGLGVLPGQVRSFQPGQLDETGRKLKVPHMGWNAIDWQRNDPLLAGLDQGESVYFVHGYYCQPDESQQSVAAAWCDYGHRFCATAWRGRVWATQFHPEKSQRAGLRILQNFAGL